MQAFPHAYTKDGSNWVSLWAIIPANPGKGSTNLELLRIRAALRHLETDKHIIIRPQPPADDPSANRIVIRCEILCDVVDTEAAIRRLCMEELYFRVRQLQE